MSTSELPALDLRGLNPAPVTPFTPDGDVDHAAMAGLGKWLAGIDGVKSLVVLGHAGEGTFLTAGRAGRAGPQPGQRGVGADHRRDHR